MKLLNFKNPFRYLLHRPQEDNFDPENPQKKVAKDTESFRKPLMNDHFEGFCPASIADWTLK